ncbi:MAG: DUF1499 domain-containing protein [Anaerolineales bacterium]|nr:DUF1499 domain-containing protein [Anaerolineales bacterium]
MRKWFGRGTLLGIAGLLIMIVVTRLVMARSQPPAGLGLTNGQLAPCPPSPNCVNSQSSTGTAAIDPIPYDGDTVAAQAALVAIIGAMDRSVILTAEPDYIHAVFRSALFDFPDDAEFYFDEPAGLIHIRFASRYGYGDLGANHDRAEAIREEFQSFAAD